MVALLHSTSLLCEPSGQILPYATLFFVVFYVAQASLELTTLPPLPSEQ